MLLAPVQEKKTELVFLIGGFIGPGPGSPTSTEVISSNGSCNHTDGFPAPIPDARVGHVAGLIGQTVITCGGAGILDSAIQVVANLHLSFYCNFFTYFLITKWQ